MPSITLRRERTFPRTVVITHALRTPIGRFQGGLSGIAAPELGAHVIRELVRRSGIEPSRIDEVLMGSVIQAGQGQAPARQAAIKAGLPPSVGATTVNKICGSGLKTVMFAAQAIALGEADILVAGGMENMSLGPHLLPQARQGYRLGNGVLVDATVHDGLWCAFENQHMGHAAEWIAQQYRLTREELDRYALESHRRAVAAARGGEFETEIVPLEIPQRRGASIAMSADECPREDTSLEALARLRPVFRDDGMITAGNAPGITDGAAAVMVMSGETARSLGLQPMARIVGYDQAAVEPHRVFEAPVAAVRSLLGRAGIGVMDVDLFEINEAFASQILANIEALDLDRTRVNVRGGAIALGHPIGASGARVLVTLLHALRDRRLRTGLAALCLGGGEAVCMLVDSP